MKISISIEAESVNILALNMGKIAVEIDGIDPEGLIRAVNENGYMLHFTDEPSQIKMKDALPQS